MSNQAPNEKKPEFSAATAKATAPSNPASEKAPGIPVGNMRFVGPTDLQGGNDSSFGCPGKKLSEFFYSDGKRRGGSGFVVEYLPWMRHFKIDYYGKVEDPVKTRYVHETQVRAWDPLI